MKKLRRVAGCVPIRFVSLHDDLISKDPTELIEVLFISSRHHLNKWLFPKGGIKRNEDAKEAALRESWEEAGVKGTILGHLHDDAIDPIYDDERRILGNVIEESQFYYDEDFIYDEKGKRIALLPSTYTEQFKTNSEESITFDPDAISTIWFILQVTEESLFEYPEYGQRKKTWMDLEEARKRANIVDHDDDDDDDGGRFGEQTKMLLEKLAKYFKESQYKMQLKE